MSAQPLITPTRSPASVEPGSGRHQQKDEERAETQQRNDEWTDAAEVGGPQPCDRQVGGQRAGEGDDPGDEPVSNPRRGQDAHAARSVS
jgi:hypothetical protein